MRNGLLFFLGLFAALLISWAGVVLGSNAQLGHLAPYFDENDGKAYPENAPGVAARGLLVYDDLGCAACHTQQVRRPSFGSDKERGWGDRQSVARDYIRQSHVQLGDSRLGPDLSNVGNRKPPYDADDLYQLLYAGHGGMPSYRFLFDDRAVIGQVSSKALNLVGSLAPAAGHEIVPSRRAQVLVAYLLSLNNVYEYPEARPVEPAAAEKGEHK